MALSALGGLALAGGLAFAAVGASPPFTGGWDHYLGGPGNGNFSPLTQITKQNVKQLKVAWQVETGVGGLQTNPLMVGRTLFAYTPQLHVLALDAATGKTKWNYDPQRPGTQPSRGFAYWQEGSERRLFAGIMNELVALDPDTGKLIPGFGKGGKVDLRENLRGKVEDQITYLTSPGTIYRDMVIVGFRTSEGHPASPGAIRAYDVRTGALRWTFNTVPKPGDFGYESWAGADTIGAGANSWSGQALDKKRGIIFIPTSPATSDFYGVDRKGDDLFSNSLVALDANTGKRLWHFQFVRHDLWDRDIPSPPVLITVRRGGKSIDAVAQTTKQGFVFVFDRVTGKPLFPIDEMKVPTSTIPGEYTAPTQPVPRAPAPYARNRLTEKDLTTRTPEAHAWALQRLKEIVSTGLFTPLGLKQTVVFPGFDGGAEWGGPAVDNRSGVLYVNANDIAWTGALAEVKDQSKIGPGEAVYQSQCMGCHGADRAGAPPAFPSLVERAAKMTDDEIVQTVRNGKGRMPPFAFGISPVAFTDLIKFIRTGTSTPSVQPPPASAAAAAATHRFTGFNKFYDPEGYPAVAAPWGTFNAIDLSTGKYLWKVPLGQYPELVAKGMPDTGSENYGGPVLTANGLLFIGATIFDHKFRVFDAKNGKLLWETELPYSGNATPAVYMVDGKQYVVIATSGARDKTRPQGSAYVAFALPDR